MTYVVRNGERFELDLYRRDQTLPPVPLVIAIHRQVDLLDDADGPKRELTA